MIFVVSTSFISSICLENNADNKGFFSHWGQNHRRPTGSFFPCWSWGSCGNLWMCDHYTAHAKQGAGCPGNVRILIKFLLTNQKNLNDRGCKHFALSFGCVSRIADEKNAQWSFCFHNCHCWSFELPFPGKLRPSLDQRKRRFRIEVSAQPAAALVPDAHYGVPLWRDTPMWRQCHLAGGRQVQCLERACCWGCSSSWKWFNHSYGSCGGYLPTYGDIP